PRAGRGAGVAPVAAALAAIARALVPGEVGAPGAGMRLAEPLQTEAVTDLLVGGGDEDQVAGAAPPLTRELGHRDGGSRDLALHVERAASPHETVDELAAERVALPLVRVREHNVRVREHRERRPVGG